MTDYSPKKGDYVRVTIEGEVEGVSGRHGWFGVGGQEVYFDGDFTVEKIAPPVETFKPGDVVRRKDDVVIFTISRAGYIRHDEGVYYPVMSSFTSENYEKVNLSV